MSDDATATVDAPVTQVSDSKKAKLNTDHKKGTLYKFNPFDLVIDDSRRGRHRPPTDDQVTQMAISLWQHGQITPIAFRPELKLDKEGKAEPGRPVVTAGFTRTEAAKLLRKGFYANIDQVNDQGEVVPVRTHIVNADFMLEGVLTKESDDEAFVRNIVENAHRNQTTLIDDAYNQQRLREQPYGYTDRKIAGIFGVTPARISQLKHYLEMPEELQELVHAGRISGNAAELLERLPEAEYAEIVEKIKAGISVPTAEIKGELRKYLNTRPRTKKTADNGVAEDTDTETGTAEGNGTVTEAPAPKAKAGRPKQSEGDADTRRDAHELHHCMRQLTHKEVFEACPKLHEAATAFRAYFLGTTDENMLYSALEKVFECKLPDPAALSF